MKPLPLVLVVLLSCMAGAAGGYLAARVTQPDAGTPALAMPEPKSRDEGLAKPGAREAELAAKVETLERSLDALHQDFAELRAGSSRTAAIETVQPEKAPVDADAMAFAALHKSAIKAVIEEDRAEQVRKAEEERKQRALEVSQQQAERTAKKLGMDAGQTKQLANFYEQRRTRMEDLRTQMQNGGGDPQAMRDTFQELRTWGETELTKTFGADLGAKIAEEDRGNFGRGFGGPGGGPGGGGQGGGNNGGGRRGRGGNGAGGGAGATGGAPGNAGPGGG